MQYEGSGVCNAQQRCGNAHGGIGTFLLAPDEDVASVLSARKDGCRLIDTANAYVNEKAVGRAMKKSGTDRGEIFVQDSAAAPAKNLQK